MTTFDIISFILVVVVIFASPVVFLKLLPILRNKFEPVVSLASLSDDEKKKFQTQKDAIRGFASAFLFFGVLIFVLTLLNDLEKSRPFFITGALMFILGGLGVWKRVRWAAWFTIIPLMFFGVYTVWQNWENWYFIIILFMFSKVASEVERCIQQTKILEVDK